VTCPHCGKKLSPEEIKKLWAQFGGSQTTDAKRKANSERAKARWAKVREEKAKKDPDI
jgi:hypothetical protein